QQLVHRIRKQGITELVMALNPTLEGDGTALFITNLLQNDKVTITRLARGIASGSVLEFANREMLADALRGRQQF
ncbi:MAG TPA: toprim domain-containing protein, partial [Planctomycetaceae bacterium]|nr:toprim domain-containing protein [Planctomycetaceae bacterium]